MERKQDIRKELLKKRNSLTEEQREKYSKLIAEKLFTLNQYTNADTLLIYVSYQSEVSTYNIREAALHDGKKIYCPKVLSPGIMEFYKINSLKDVISGYKNIPEPASAEFQYQCTEVSKTLMIMPLVGFDNSKNRLGYGGGFYDRYLQKFPAIKRIALSFECQKYDLGLPMEKNDKKTDFIITEHMIY